jgi:hypothetical protein
MSLSTMAATRQKEMNASIALDAIRTRAAGAEVSGLEGLEMRINLYCSTARIKKS